MNAKMKAAGVVEIPAGTDGRMPLAGQAAKRTQDKLAEARAALAAQDAAAKALDAEQIADVVVVAKPKAKKIPAALNLVPTPKAAQVKAVKVANAKKLVETVAAVTAPAAQPELAKLLPTAWLGFSALQDSAVKLTVVQGTAAAGTKVCSKCKVAKPLNAETFARDKSSKDGFYGQCKQCESEYRAAKKLAAAVQPAPVAEITKQIAAATEKVATKKK